MLRFTSGLLFLVLGLLKVFVFTIRSTVGFFECLGLPAFFVCATIAGEIGGGLLWIADVYSRLVALALVPILLGASDYNVSEAFCLGDPEGNGIEV